MVSTLQDNNLEFINRAKALVMANPDVIREMKCSGDAFRQAAAIEAERLAGMSL